MNIIEKAGHHKQLATISYYAVNNEGVSVAKISIQDGTYPGYSIVPTIIQLEGAVENVLPLLDWMISKLKGPLTSAVNRSVLREYGFEKWEGGLVWVPSPRLSHITRMII